MASAKVRADYEQLADIARVFNTQAERGQQLLAALQKSMETLQGGDWVGKSADKFYAEMKSAVLPAMTRVVRAMDEAATATRQISGIMKQAEEESAALFRLIHGLESPDGSGSAPAPAGQPVSAFTGDPSAAGSGSTGAGAGAAGSRSRSGAVDLRAEQVQIALDDAHRAKAQYEAAWSDRYQANKQYRKAIKEARDARTIGRLKNDLAEAQRLQDACEQLMNKQFEEAVHLTAKLYKIDMSAVKAVHYKGEGDHHAMIDGKRVLDIRYDAFSSPGWLASNLLHEATHARQILRDGGVRQDAQGFAMNEIQAYHQQLAHAQAFGLTQAEINEIKEACQGYYKDLIPENQRRVNQGVYDPIRR
jgi:WXG100 family type VII secretion target